MREAATNVPPRLRPLARGEGWSADEFICTLGPEDPAFEERHEQVSIAAVLDGSFHYRSSQGHALLYPGALLLGAAGTGYECSHAHSRGDRCLAFHFEPGYFADLAGEIAGTRFRLRRPMLPALPEQVPLLTEIAAAAQASIPAAHLAFDELAIRLVAMVVERQTAGPELSALARDEGRIVRALHHIEENADAPLDLPGLATVAGLSKFRFLRAFRRATGITPYQFVLTARLARVALALRAGPAPVSSLAFDAGFGDLSTFNHRFRRIFGMSPRQWRIARRR